MGSNSNRRYHKRSKEAERHSQYDKLVARANRYKQITKNNIDELRADHVDVIDLVLTYHRSNETLPSVLDEEFPQPTDFTWPGPAGEFSKNFVREAKWTFARISSNRHKLLQLLQLRRRFATHLILNQLDSAAFTIDLIKNRFGVSIWSLESELLLAEHRGGFEHNREILSHILSRRLPTNAHLLAELASQRVDATVSPARYLRTVASFIEAGDYDKLDKNLPFYLQFSLASQLEQKGKINHEAAAFFLYLSSTQPLIDQYCAAVKLFRYLLSNGQYELIHQLTSHQRLSSLAEPELSIILSCGFGINPPSHKTRFYHILRIFLNGKYDEVLPAAAEQLCDDPLNLAWYELVARSAILARETLPRCLPANSKAGSLLEAIHTFYQFGESCNHSFLALVKNALALDSTPLGYQLTGFCLRGIPRLLHEWNWSNVVFTECPHPFDLGFLPRKSQQNGYRLIGSMSDAATASEYQALDQDVRNPELSLDSVEIADPIAEQLRGKALICDGNLLGANELFRRGLSRPDQPPLLVAESLRGRFDCLLGLGDFNSAAVLASSDVVHTFAMPHLADLGRILERYTQGGDAIDKTCIAWPILFFLGYAYGNSSREDLFSAYANFMETTGVSRPSHLAKSAANKHGHTQMCFFLRLVCSPDIIDSDIEFSGTADIESERVAICQLLQELDPPNAAPYAEEISQLQQNLAVRQAMRHVAVSKIHFNLEGIEKALDPTYHDRFHRYHAMAQLGEESRKTVDLHWGQVSLSGEHVVDASMHLFRELFDEARQAFLFSDEHGLDSYLSVRVRHQTIKGALRSIFDRFNLVTEKANGVYVDNEAWANELREAPTAAQSTAQNSLASFSEEVDSIISKVSGNWMRIRGAPGGDYGLFQIDFSEGELIKIHQALRHTESEFEFLDSVFGLLRIRLDDCLKFIRKRIEVDLHGLFVKEIDGLESALNRLGPALPNSLKSAITHCRTDLQNGLREIAEWFQLQDVAQLEEFSVFTLVTAAIENISQCFPSSAFRCNVNSMDVDIKLRGTSFVPLWDVFFVVFENIVRYSGENSRDTVLEVAIDGSHLTFTITNPLGSLQSEDEIQIKLNELSSYSPEFIRKEGGSGFTKLRKLLRYDLKLVDECVDLHVSNRIFTTRIRLKREVIER